MESSKQNNHLEPVLKLRRIASSRLRVDRMLLTVAETAELLRVSKATVFVTIRSGRLKSVKIGARRLVPLDAVRAFLDELSQEENL
ncbi:helix-turn-helix domain-containing protein [Fodinicola acaciae]|uniref:helix-turn-helix domain-containing protein n=1 Tax=Fodinicola acaciae TaxID=2681555 RepID=UPI0013D17BB1|nr:helix-turn-helix domain-containing protein [Fodinicola acaciae]